MIRARRVWAPATTPIFVTMKPSPLTMKPEPWLGPESPVMIETTDGTAFWVTAVIAASSLEPRAPPRSTAGVALRPCRRRKPNVTPAPTAPPTIAAITNEANRAAGVARRRGTGSGGDSGPEGSITNPVWLGARGPTGRPGLGEALGRSPGRKPPTVRGPDTRSGSAAGSARSRRIDRAGRQDRCRTVSTHSRG